MSITDELRECINERGVFAQPSRLLRIADRIDAEHERATAGCIHYDPERHYCAVHGGTEHGWVRLPVDADGVPIRIGDRIEYLTGGRDIVRFVTLNGDGWMVNERGWKPCTMRHYAPPTVEDVLTEFAQRNAEIPNDESGAEPFKALLAEYAAKLRLAGEGE